MKCNVCGDFLPPGYTEKTDDGKGNKCVFCMQEKNDVKYNIDGNSITVNKKQLIKEYKEYLNYLKENSDVVKMLIKQEGDKFEKTET